MFIDYSQKYNTKYHHKFLKTDDINIEDYNPKDPNKFFVTDGEPFKFSTCSEMMEYEKNNAFEEQLMYCPNVESDDKTIDISASYVRLEDYLLEKIDEIDSSKTLDDIFFGSLFIEKQSRESLEIKYGQYWYKQENIYEVNGEEGIYVEFYIVENCYGSKVRNVINDYLPLDMYANCYLGDGENLTNIPCEYDVYGDCADDFSGEHVLVHVNSGTPKCPPSEKVDIFKTILFKDDIDRINQFDDVFDKIKEVENIMSERFGVPFYDEILRLDACCGAVVLLKSKTKASCGCPPELPPVPCYCWKGYLDLPEDKRREFLKQLACCGLGCTGNYCTGQVYYSETSKEKYPSFDFCSCMKHSQLQFIREEEYNENDEECGYPISGIKKIYRFISTRTNMVCKELNKKFPNPVPECVKKVFCCLKENPYIDLDVNGNYVVYDNEDKCNPICSGTCKELITYAKLTPNKL